MAYKREVWDVLVVGQADTGLSMLKRWITIIGALSVSVISLSLYIAYRIPPGVTPMGDREETIAWIALATSIASALTALAGLAQKLIELRKR